MPIHRSFILFFTAFLFLFASACGSVETPTASLESPPNTPTQAAPEPSATLPPPSETPEPTATATPEPTETPVPPTATLAAQPTIVPNVEFEVLTEGLKLQLTTHLCNLQMVSYGTFTTDGIADDVETMMDLSMSVLKPEDGQILPVGSEEVMCYFTGKVVEGAATQEQLKAWADGKAVYLLDPAGKQSDLIYGGLNGEKELLLLFTAPRGYAPVQLQMTDVLVDMP